MTKLEATRGPYKLYIGSRTADPVKSIKLTSLDGVEAGTAIKTMLRILAWMMSTGSNEELLQFLKTQPSARMVGLKNIIEGIVPGTAGGSIDHRFGSPGTVMWAFINSTSIISTWYQIRSNRATILQRGEEDRFVSFQQLFQHIYGALRFCRPYNHRIQAVIALDHCSYLIPKSEYNSPQLYLPGIQNLYGGPVLDNDRRTELEQEAIHYQSVSSTSVLPTTSPILTLAATVAQEVVAEISAYSRGVHNLDLEDHQMGASQSRLNLTVIRKVPLPVLLGCIGIQLSVSGYLGKKMKAMIPNK